MLQKTLCYELMSSLFANWFHPTSTNSANKIDGFSIRTFIFLSEWIKPAIKIPG